jgi:hypothetical protein
MKLIDLAPHWVTLSRVAEGVKFYYGVSFLCPHCDHTDCPACGTKRGRRIAFSFWPPIDPDGWESKITPIPHNGFHNRVSGDTFETLTIGPSIGIEGHWHGSIINGELR